MARPGACYPFVLVALAALAPACPAGSPPDPPQKKESSMTLPRSSGAPSGRPSGAPAACAEALRVLAAHDFPNWRGLPKGCALADVAAVLTPVSDGRAQVVLGGEIAFFGMYRSPAFVSPLRVWTRDDVVLLIDADARELSGSLPGWLAALGEPAARLDHFTDGIRSKGGEWVYPERGLALFLDGARQALIRFAVFVPTTLDGYTAHVRLEMRPTRVPMRSGGGP